MGFTFAFRHFLSVYIEDNPKVTNIRANLILSNRCSNERCFEEVPEWKGEVRKGKDTVGEQGACKMPRLGISGFPS